MSRRAAQPSALHRIRCYITDRKSLGGGETERRTLLLACVQRACAAGVDYVQLREGDLAAPDLEKLAAEVVRVARGRAPVLVNARADVALAAGAAGVHLPSGEAALSASEVRTLWLKASPLAPMIGVSCHTLEDVRGAEAQGADFAVFGPVFAKSGVPAPGGLARLEAVCRREHALLPVLALGGVNEENAESCMRAGAAGVAGIRMWQR